ncbi:MAG: N-formylglutamate amidohydrolase [Patescibacteria group bacterium]
MKRPILITLSHCSDFLPTELRARLNLDAYELRHKSDPATERIFGVRNATHVAAKFSRIIGDPNADPQNFDPQNPAQNCAVSLQPLRGKQVLRMNPSAAEVAAWRKKFVEPFYREIERNLPHTRFLLDGHSHFSRDRDTDKPRADIVISNRNFETCGAELTQQIVNFFARRGFSVAVNTPFRGGFLLKKFCGKRNPPGIQLEIKRSLYLDEKTLKVRGRDVARLRGTIEELVELLARKI